MTITDFVNQFKNRQKEEYHFTILSLLKAQGPMPPTILSYRAEFNDSQGQDTIDFLAENNMVTIQELTDKVRAKYNLPWGYSSKSIIEITEKGVKYLELLSVLLEQINWKVVQDNNRKRKQAINKRKLVKK